MAFTGMPAAAVSVDAGCVRYLGPDLMLNKTSPATPDDRKSDVWIVDIVRTPLCRPGKSLHEVQPSALLAGLIGQVGKGAEQSPLNAVDSLLIGAAAAGSVVAETLPWALSRAGAPTTVATGAIEGGDEAGLQALRLAIGQLRAGDAAATLAGAIHLPSRGREQRRANPDALGALAAQAVTPRVAADVMASLHGVGAVDVAGFCDRARQSGVPQAVGGMVPILDLNGLTIAGTDALVCAEPQSAATAEEPWRAHHELARSTYPQLKEIARIHNGATDAPALEGASLALLARPDVGRQMGWKPRARVAACATAGHRRLQIGDAAIAAFQRALNTVAWSAQSIDRVAVCSSFAGVQLAVARVLGVDADRLDTSCAAWWHSNAGAVSPVLALDRMVRALETSGEKRAALVACGDSGSVVVVLLERGHDD